MEPAEARVLSTPTAHWVLAPLRAQSAPVGVATRARTHRVAIPLWLRPNHEPADRSLNVIADRVAIQLRVSIPGTHPNTDRAGQTIRSYELR